MPVKIVKKQPSENDGLKMLSHKCNKQLIKAEKESKQESVKTVTLTDCIDIIDPEKTVSKNILHSMKCCNCYNNACDEFYMCKPECNNMCVKQTTRNACSDVDCHRKRQMEMTECLKIHYNRSWDNLKNIIRNEFKYIREEMRGSEKELNPINDECNTEGHNDPQFYSGSNLDNDVLNDGTDFCEKSLSNVFPHLSVEGKVIQRGFFNNSSKMSKIFKEDNLKFFKTGNTTEILTIDRNDPELRIFAAKVGIDIDDDVDRKPNRIFRLDHLTPAYIEDPPIPNGNILGGHYGFASEFQLKEKYSTDTFEFLTNVVKEYAIFLKEHPSKEYPSVSELMVHPDQKLSNEESERARYYDEKYLRTGPKEGDCVLSTSVDSNNIQCAKYIDTNTNSECVVMGGKIKCDPKLVDALKRNKIIRMKQKEEKWFGYYVPSPDSDLKDTTKCSNFLFSGLNKTIRRGPLTQAEVNEARKTGILNLSHRCLLEVPERVWSIDVTTQEDRNAYEEHFEVPVHPNLWCSFKSVISLNLSYNSLTTIYPQGSALVTLRELHVTNNMLEELPEEIGNLQNLKFLDLDTNFLKTLPSFANLKNLEELKLKRNFIEKLPETFGNLISLQKLDLSFNKLEQLPDSLNDLQCLENLNLSFNKLSSLPKKFNKLKKLEALDVSFNKIVDLPSMNNMDKLIVVNATCNAIHLFPNFNGCKMLTEIRLDGNNIKHVITENLKDCPLIQLTMPNNKVDAIPDDLYQVSTLVVIDFCNNNLLWLPWSLARLKYLTVLNVDCNHISNVERSVLDSGSENIIKVLREKLIRYEGDDCLRDPEKHGDIYSHVEVLYEKHPKNLLHEELNKKVKADMKKTRSLVCKNMELDDLPVSCNLLQEAKQCRVYKVNLTNNNFSYVPTGLKILIPYLTELILKENYLKTVPDFIFRKNLEILDLSSNCLDSLPLSLGSSKLKTLNAGNNCFAAVPKMIYSVHTLENLNFERNRITEIDADRLRNLRNLSYLNFSHNLIEKLPAGLVYLPCLVSLNVSNNLFKKPGSDILNKGTEAVLEYLSRTKTNL